MTPDQPHRECGHSSCGQNYIDTGDTACSLVGGGTKAEFLCVETGSGASAEFFCVEIGPDTHPTVSDLVRELLLSYEGDGRDDDFNRAHRACEHYANSVNATVTELLDEIDPRLND